MPTKVPIGSEFTEFPGRSFNELIDGYNRFNATLPRNGANRSGNGPAIVVLVQNKSGAAVDAGGVLVIDGPVLTIPEAGTSLPYQSPIIKGVTPADPGSFGSYVVLRDYIPDDGVGPATLQGLCWVLVDVTDAEHTRASLKDGETGFLESGTAGVQLLYKEKQEEDGSARLGEQWALALIGGSEAQKGQPGGGGLWIVKGGPLIAGDATAAGGPTDGLAYMMLLTDGSYLEANTDVFADFLGFGPPLEPTSLPVEIWNPFQFPMGAGVFPAVYYGVSLLDTNGDLPKPAFIITGPNFQGYDGGANQSIGQSMGEAEFQDDGACP